MNIKKNEQMAHCASPYSVSEYMIVKPVRTHPPDQRDRTSIRYSEDQDGAKGMISVSTNFEIADD